MQTAHPNFTCTYCGSTPVQHSAQCIKCEQQELSTWRRLQQGLLCDCVIFSNLRLKLLCVVSGLLVWLRLAGAAHTAQCCTSPAPARYCSHADMMSYCHTHTSSAFYFIKCIQTTRSFNQSKTKFEESRGGEGMQLQPPLKKYSLRWPYQLKLYHCLRSRPISLNVGRQLVGQLVSQLVCYTCLSARV